jgi:hypothetical protein
MNTNVTNTFAIAAAMLVLALLLGFLALGVGRFMGPRPRPAEQNPRQYYDMMVGYSYVNNAASLGYSTQSSSLLAAVLPH